MDTRLPALLLLAVVLLGCANRQQPASGDSTQRQPPPQDGAAPNAPAPTRESRIPPDAVKAAPGADAHPPILHSGEFEAPVPLAGIDTAGAEDSPFIPADRDELYFFFTPDVRQPPEKQLLDGVTGIYRAKLEDGRAGEAARVVLQKPGKLALDGCPFAQGGELWFCSAREGFEGIHWFVAAEADGKWSWKSADFEADYEVGELHLCGDGLYYHADRAGGKGGLDIWISTKSGGGWQTPVNMEAVNTPDDEGWPYLTADCGELWFLRTYRGAPAVFRSKKAGEGWGAPELIVSQFAGEPTLDSKGNLYFVHHYFKDGKMVEADIYVAPKKRGLVP